MSGTKEFYELDKAYTHTSKVKEALGAYCQDCGAVFTTSSEPWHWRKSQAMHEKESKHTMGMFKVTGQKDVR